MKKALLVTDGSIDLALSLSRWLETQSESIDLTVVYTFSINQPTDQPLKAANYREAKQNATETLNHWLNFLPKTWLGQLHTELLLGDPELVLTIHLLLRRYDYLLMEVGQQGVLSTFLSCQPQISTQLKCLSLPTKLIDPIKKIREIEWKLQVAAIS